MFRIIYAVERECMPEGFEDNLVFAEGEYEMMLFENDTMIEVDGEMRPYPELFISPAREFIIMRKKED